MSGLIVAREPIQTLWTEIVPLLYAHWREIATWQDIELNPDLDSYEALEEAGMLRVYTAREDGKLVGYAAFFVRTNMHYSDSLQAQQDVLFLAPSHRKGTTGIRLIQRAEEELAKEGVQVVYHHVKVAHDFGPVLERKGYKLVEKIYAKRIR